MTDAAEVPGPPTNLDFERALMFFHSYMYGPLQGRLRIYAARSIPPAVAMPADWEVFASMLVNDLGRKFGAGIDLANFEVKSAKRGSSFEYQYHKNTGLQKLAKDRTVGHLFFSYAENLREVDLRYAHGSAMEHFFDQWLATYPNPYLQRYRKNVPYGWVKDHGQVLMSLRDGELTFPPVAFVPAVAPINDDEE